MTRLAKKCSGLLLVILLCAVSSEDVRASKLRPVFDSFVLDYHMDTDEDRWVALLPLLEQLGATLTYMDNSIIKSELISFEVNFFIDNEVVEVSSDSSYKVITDFPIRVVDNSVYILAPKCAEIFTFTMSYGDGFCEFEALVPLAVLIPGSVLFSVPELIEASTHAYTKNETAQYNHPDDKMQTPQIFSWIVEYSKHGVNRDELELIALVNDVRMRNGLEPLAVDRDMSQSARLMAQLMDEFEASPTDWWHSDPYYGSPRDRIKVFAPSSRPVYENVAYAISALGAFNSMMNSKGHRMLILSRDFKSVGAGVQGRIYTLTFK